MVLIANSFARFTVLACFIAMVGLCPCRGGMVAKANSGEIIRPCCACHPHDAADHSTSNSKEKSPDCPHCGTAVYAVYAGDHTSDLIPDFQSASHCLIALDIVVAFYHQKTSTDQDDRTAPKSIETPRITCALRL